MTLRTTRTLMAACVATALLASCNDESVAGTSDEAQTSLKLQLLADNLRSVPPRGAPPIASVVARTAARRAEAVPSGCVETLVSRGAEFYEMGQFGWAWRFESLSQHDCGGSEPDLMLVNRHTRDTDLEWWEAETLWMSDPYTIAANRGRVEVRTPAGFQYEITFSSLPLGPTTSQLHFTDLGWRAEFVRPWRDRSVEAVPTQEEQGGALLQGDTPVGRLVFDTLQRGYRVFGLDGREYVPGDKQVHRPDAADSLGAWILVSRRDTVDGIEGVRIALSGRLPADSGLRFGEVRAIYSSEAGKELESSAPLQWTDGTMAPELFFPGLPPEAGRVGVQGTILWSQPAGPTERRYGTFLSSSVPIR